MRKLDNPYYIFAKEYCIKNVTKNLEQKTHVTSLCWILIHLALKVHNVTRVQQTYKLPKLSVLYRSSNNEYDNLIL